MVEALKRESRIAIESVKSKGTSKNKNKQGNQCEPREGPNKEKKTPSQKTRLLTQGLCRSGGTSLQHQQHTLSATRKSPSGPGQISLDVGPRTCNVTCIKHLAMLFHDPPELNSSRSINSCDRSAHSGSRTTHGYSGP